MERMFLAFNVFTMVCCVILMIQEIEAHKSYYCLLKLIMHWDMPIDSSFVFLMSLIVLDIPTQNVSYLWPLMLFNSNLQETLFRVQDERDDW